MPICKIESIKTQIEEKPFLPLLYGDYISVFLQCYWIVRIFFNFILSLLIVHFSNMNNILRNLPFIVVDPSYADRVKNLMENENGFGEILKQVSFPLNIV